MALHRGDSGDAVQRPMAAADDHVVGDALAVELGGHLRAVGRQRPGEQPRRGFAAGTESDNLARRTVLAAADKRP